jgi:uncharacterized membrane protein
MKSAGLFVLGGVGVSAGAGLMYLFDPRSGRRRRGELRNEVFHDARSVRDGVGKTARDIEHRSRGLAARLRGRFSGREAPDAVIEGRVRAALGRASSHPRALDLVVEDGKVLIAGPVLTSEHHRVLDAIMSARGVKGVTDMLEPHETADGLSALQGGLQPRPGLLGTRWSPAASVLAALTGGGLLALGRRSRAFGRWAAGSAGGLLLVRALFNQPLGALVGLGPSQRGVRIQKAIHVDAPIEEVFAFWRNLESFPRFMSHVREVRRLPDGAYRWKVGPFEWDAEVTRLEPHRLLAWRSRRGAVVRNRGVVRFRQDGHRGTEVAVQLAYRPPVGMLGHGLARLLGVDPKHQMDDDLLRFKSLVEQGAATGRGDRVYREEIRRG